eukprot:gb/GECG01002939.1/.p1 GENE.gb/GECG01002939.1/~~gb/GECG01002939.1/.p1  ORF type:complete len:541 (+),score=74.55 gb/GECG01002939.1/:1-1623(+)
MVQTDSQKAVGEKRTIGSYLEDEDKAILGKLTTAGLCPNVIERVANVPEIGTIATHSRTFHRKKVTTEHIPNCGSICFKKIKKLTNDGSPKVCLVMDESPLKLLGMPCFLVVLISADIEKPIVLDVATPKKYNGEFVEKITMDVLEDFGIKPEQLVAISSDNASYMVKGVNLLRKKPQFKHVLHARCLAHGGDLMVETMINKLDGANQLLKLLRQLSYRGSGQIAADCEEAGVFIQNFRHAQTRWNTAVPALQHAFEKRHELIEVLENSDEIDGAPLVNTLKDDAVLAQTKLALRFCTRIDEFIKIAQHELSTERDIRLGKQLLASVFEDLSASSEQSIKDEIEDFSLRAGERLEVVGKFHNGLKSAQKKYKDNVEETLDFFCTFNCFLPSFLNDLPAHTDLMSFQNCFGFKAGDSRIDVEWLRYINEKKTSREENPILYWKEMRGTYPQLADWVLGRLGIPFSSASVERAFSCVTRQQQDFRRNAQEPKAFKMEMFVRLNDWIIDEVLADFRTYRQQKALKTGPDQSNLDVAVDLEDSE